MSVYFQSFKVVFDPAEYIDESFLARVDIFDRLEDLGVMISYDTRIKRVTDQEENSYTCKYHFRWWECL
jgi:hypothetical protein